MVGTVGTDRKDGRDGRIVNHFIKRSHFGWTENYKVLIANIIFIIIIILPLVVFC